MSDPVLDLIADLRGGRPDKCDFCGQPTGPESLTPEEGGDWACLTCWERWEREDPNRPIPDWDFPRGGDDQC